MVNFQNVTQARLRLALAASVALHLLLLWPAASFHRQDDGFGQSLSIVLRPQSASSQSEHRTSPPSDNSARDVRKAAAAVPVGIADPAGAASSSKDFMQGPAEPLHAKGEAGGTSAGRDSAQHAPGAAPGLDADGVRQYRMALAVEARRFKRYPPRALADEIGGTAEVRVAVSAGGHQQEIALARSSGHEALDEAALEMMRKAAPRTLVPEMLRGRSFAVNLPVVFDVSNE